MMMVQYLLDNDLPVGVPGIDEVRNDFTSVRELVEQFMQWFLKEQVEEVATVSTLLTVVERAGDNLFHVEDFVAREMARPAGTDTTAPKAAGAAV
jgi:ferritin